MVIRAKIDKSAIRSLISTIQARLSEMQPKILSKAALIARDRMKSNPVVFIAPVLEILREMQGEYYAGSSVGAKDPADFEEGAAVTLEVVRNLNKTLVVIPTKEGLTWQATVVSEEFVGFGDNSIVGKPTDRGKPGTLPWIAFFLAGSIEENLLWMSDDILEKIGWTHVNHMGRFGKGFLMRGTKKRIAMLKARGVSKEEVLHPISGKAGRDWFNGLHEKISKDPRFFNMYIQPAIRQATQEAVQEIIRTLVK